MPPELRVNHARMKGISRDSGPSESLAQLPREQNVGQLGLLIGLLSAVGPALEVDVFQVHLAPLVRQRGDRHDARRGRFLQRRR